MASLNELIEKKLNAINEASDRFISRVKAIQNRILAEIAIKLNKLKRDESGEIKLNISNQNEIDRISESYEKFKDSPEYRSAVSEFMASFDAQKAINDEIISLTLDVDLKVDPAVERFFQTSRANAIEILTKGAFDKAVPEFKTILKNAIGSADTFSNLIKNIRTNIIGSDVLEGSLERYAKTYAKDLFTISERQYTQQIMQGYNVQFFQYAGALQDTSRQFCEERHRKIYHINEIENWAHLTWAGKIKGTNEQNIRDYLGGYNCNHSLIPKAIRFVPDNVIQRNLDNGNITLNDIPEEKRNNFTG